MKVLVLGSTGLIGHQVYSYLKKYSQYELFNISYRKRFDEKTILCDVRDELLFINKIEEINPDIIINCVGILIEGANSNPENAIFINGYIPHRLMRLANELNAKLIHISTDCVFSGDKQESYKETDLPDGQGVYAKSKALGEIINDKHLTLRTSVVGPELKTDGEELFHWFMNQTGTINGFTEAIWSGVTTLELAKAVYWAIENNICGLYHVTNNDVINKYELLSLFKKYMNKEIEINPIEGRIANKSFIDTREERDYIIPTYEEMVKEMTKLINENKSLYSQYFLDEV